MATVLITGATGTLGRAVVERLAARQYRTRILSHQVAPAPREDVEVVAGDLVTGRGLRDAVSNVHTIIHCASAPRNAQQVDVEGTRVLLQVAHDNGVAHIIYPSIVGIDRSDYPYYVAKLAVEQAIERGPVPWTNIRITQFHDLVLEIIRSFGADSLAVVPVVTGMRFQSIDVGEAADHLVELLEHGPAGHMPALGGPQILTIEEMTEAYLRIRGRRATTRLEAKEMYAVFKSGINLVPERAVGTVTWDAFLQQRFVVKQWAS